MTPEEEQELRDEIDVLKNVVDRQGVLIDKYEAKVEALNRVACEIATERDAVKDIQERQAMRITHLVMERRGSGTFADAHERLATISGEAFGPFPVQTFDEHLTAIEHGIHEQRIRLTNALTASEKAKNLAYDERNRCVAAMTKMAVALGWQCGIGRHAGSTPGTDDNLDPEWMNVIYIETPAGQASWHIHDRDVPLFAGLPPCSTLWDGHSTDEKYARLRRMRITSAADRIAALNAMHASAIAGEKEQGDLFTKAATELHALRGDKRVYRPVWDLLLEVIKERIPKAMMLHADVQDHGVGLSRFPGIESAYANLLDYAVNLTCELQERGFPPTVLPIHAVHDRARSKDVLAMSEETFSLHEVLRQTIYDLSAIRLIIEHRKPQT